MTAPTTVPSALATRPGVSAGRVLDRTCAAELSRLWTVKATWWFPRQPLRSWSVWRPPPGLSCREPRPAGRRPGMARGRDRLPARAVRAPRSRADGRHVGLGHRRHRPDAAVDAAPQSPVPRADRRRRRDRDMRRGPARRRREPRRLGGSPSAPAAAVGRRGRRAGHDRVRPGGRDAPRGGPRLAAAQHRGGAGLRVPADARPARSAPPARLRLADRRDGSAPRNSRDLPVDRGAPANGG